MELYEMTIMCVKNYFYIFSNCQMWPKLYFNINNIRFLASYFDLELFQF
uniref:Uncharacterized protein n=1 Tax=Anguilla anguilla TaxID=7936 RepID=A0A0E9WGS2_ANGAN